jgi:SAM-dependent methyltransferase
MHALTPPLLLRARDAGARRLAERRYARHPVPLAPGYLPHRHRFVAAVLRDEALMRTFRQGDALPPGYGRGLDERCVEYPWCLAQLPADARVVLDAGSVLNHARILDAPELAERTLHIVTLAPEAVAHWQRRISYLYADLRRLPLRDGFYDAVVCLSTLEHVGMDNTRYTRDATGREHRPGDFATAIRELHRVLRPGGTLLLSVPYGAYEQRADFQQFDRALLAQAIAAFPGAAEAEARFYRFGRDGWRLATQDACDDARFGVWGTPAAGRDPEAVPAAEAVACVRLTRAALDA